MGIVVTFQNYTPSPREDDLPWIQVQIEESPLQDGPWTLIDTQALYPLDDDPTQPQPRSFTTSNGTIPEGWYQISFLDAAGTVQPTDPVQNVTLSPHPYTPSLAAIGLVTMSRTKGQYGKLYGTFTSDTTPDNVAAAGIARAAAMDLADVIGDDIPPALVDDAQNVAAIGAALRIELAFYSDQVNTGRSIYPQLEKQYAASLAALERSVTVANEGGNDIVADEGPSLRPQFGFEPTRGWMDRRM